MRRRQKKKKKVCIPYKLMACNSYVWQSVADKSISNQKGISKQTVGLDIGYQMTATKKKGRIKYGMRD